MSSHTALSPGAAPPPGIACSSCRIIPLHSILPLRSLIPLHTSHEHLEHFEQSMSRGFCLRLRAEHEATSMSDQLETRRIRSRLLLMLLGLRRRGKQGVFSRFCHRNLIIRRALSCISCDFVTGIVLCVRSFHVYPVTLSWNRVIHRALSYDCKSL